MSDCTRCGYPRDRHGNIRPGIIEGEQVLLCPTATFSTEKPIYRLAQPMPQLSQSPQPMQRAQVVLTVQFDNTEPKTLVMGALSVLDKIHWKSPSADCASKLMDAQDNLRELLELL